jgi:hypothetical protein
VALLDLCAAVLLTTSGHSPVVKPIWPSVPSSLGTLGGKETWEFDQAVLRLWANLCVFLSTIHFCLVPPNSWAFLKGSRKLTRVLSLFPLASPVQPRHSVPVPVAPHPPSLPPLEMSWTLISYCLCHCGKMTFTSTWWDLPCSTADSKLKWGFFMNDCWYIQVI